MREPIADLVAERSLIATIGAPGSEHLAADICGDCPDGVFTHPGYKAVFCAIRSLVQGGQEVNFVTVKDGLTVAGQWGVVGYEQLTDWLGAEEVSRPRALVEILLRLHKRRELERLGETIASRSRDDGDSLKAILDATADQLAALSAGSAKGGLQAFGDVSEHMRHRWNAQGGSAGPRAIRTHFPGIDRMTRGGFRPGQLVILAARPGVGKTSLALQIAGKCSVNGGQVAVFSLEMPKDEIWVRVVASLSGVDSARVERGDMPEEAMNACDDLDQSCMLVDDTATVTINDIKSRLTSAQIKLGRPFDLVVIDYLQLISSPEDKRKQTETLRIGDITRACKLMAKDLQTPVVLLSQLNREIEKRNGGKPQLSDLRDSGSIEQDADIVIFIHPEQVASGDTPLKGEIHISKNRSGSTGPIGYGWTPQCQRFHEIERTTGARWDDCDLRHWTNGRC